MNEIINKFRFTIGNFLLNRKLKKNKRERNVVNLDEAKSIALLYNVTDEKRFGVIKKVSQQLSNANRQVMILGYIDDKNIPNYCVAANAGYYFNRKSVNWYGGPKTDYLEQFIQKPFDLFIDFTTEDYIITRYIVGLSNSKFKAGSFSTLHQGYLDMMIESNPNKSFEDYVDHTLHYLKILRSK